MAKVISICNQKGGVGKTTTAINLSSGLALEGFKTLLIDIDPQSNATGGLGIDKGSVGDSIYDALMHGLSLEELIVPTPTQNLDLVPSNIGLTGAEVELVNEPNREQRLRDVLGSVRERYKYIFIDCPPSLSLLTVNGLTASDSVTIPLQCEYYALEGISQLLETINLVKRNLNPSLEIEGVLLTMADFRTNLSRQVIAEAKRFFKDKVYETIVPRSIRLSEAPGFGQPIFLYDNNSVGARKYSELVREFIEKNG